MGAREVTREEGLAFGGYGSNQRGKGGCMGLGM